jgi:site-specific DNA-methyltransferase (adenine-specific)
MSKEHKAMKNSQTGGACGLQIEYRAVDALIPYDNNPRKNDKAVDAVAASISEFGFKVPIIIDSKGEIVAGHTRLKAAKQLGIDTVPVIIADDLTPEQIKAFRIADNKSAEFADWDFDLLASEFSALADLGVDLDITGFSETEIASLLDQDTEEDEIPPLPDDPKSKRGELYQLGAHRLMVGDATSAEDLERLMSGKDADLYLTEPPYNVDYTGKTKKALKIENDKQDDAGFQGFLTDAFTTAAKHLKSGAAYYIFHADSEGYNFRAAAKEAGFVLRQCLVWVKNSMVLGRQDYQWQHEPVLYGWVSGASHAWYGDRKQTTVLNFDRPTVSELHPTTKPVAMLEYLIRNSSKAGDVVLDCFLGSGSTLIACENMGRACYGLELDPRYADVIIARWEAATGDKAVLIE